MRPLLVRARAEVSVPSWLTRVTGQITPPRRPSLAISCPCKQASSEGSPPHARPITTTRPHLLPQHDFLWWLSTGSVQLVAARPQYKRACTCVEWNAARMLAHSHTARNLCLCGRARRSRAAGALAWTHRGHH